MSGNFEQSRQLEDLDDISRSLYDTLKASRDENAGYFVQIMQAIHELQLQSQDARRDTSSSDRFCIAFLLPPVAAVENFVGRGQELDVLRDTLLGTKSKRRVAVLHGLGGIGKTQLAVRFMRAHKETFRAMLWLNGSSTDALHQSFTDIARRLVDEHQSLIVVRSAIEDRDIERIVRYIKEWLAQKANTKWLLVFDNVNRPKLPGVADPEAVDIRSYFPGSDAGSVLITTRSSALQVGRMVHIKKFPGVEDGLSVPTTVSRRQELEHGK